MSDSRWQWTGLVLAAGLVIPGVFLSARAENRPGFTIRLAAATPSGSSTTLGYHASVLASDRIVAQDFFRIHDLPGYIEGSAKAPPGWTVAAERVGSGGLNLVFTYVDADPIAGPKLLKGFSALSISGHPRAVCGFVGRSTRATGAEAGSKVASAGEIRGPGAVPEPASLLSLSLGVIILGIVYAHRHRRKLRDAA